MFGFGLGQAVERLFRPGHFAIARRLLPDLLQLLRVVAGLAPQLGVFDFVLRRLHHDGALGVVAGAACAARDLVELTGFQHALARAIELGQARHEHRADGHVDAHAQSVGATNDLEQPGLREALDQPAVLRQHAGVVDADAAAHQLGQCLTKGSGEAERADLFSDLLFFFLGDDGTEGGERLGTFGRLALAEVHHVGRRFAVGEKLFDGFVHCGKGVGEIEGDRSLRATDVVRRAPSAAGKVLFEPVGVAQGGRHEQELRLGQFQQRDLPGPAAIRLGVVVELVHHHLVDVRVRSVAQGDVGHDLGGRRDDGRVAVDRRIAGHHPDVFGAKDLAEREEFLADQGLDGGGVEAALPAREGDEMRRVRHHGLAGAGGRGQDDVVAREDAQRRFFLSGVEGNSPLSCPRGKRVPDRFIDEGLGNFGEVGEHLR